MIHLALRTGYSFKYVYGHIDKIISYGEEHKCVGVADISNTFSHAGFEQKCNEKEIKPIFGVRIMVVKDATPAIKRSEKDQWTKILIEERAPLEEVVEAWVMSEYVDDSY